LIQPLAHSRITTEVFNPLAESTVRSNFVAKLVLVFAAFRSCSVAVHAWSIPFLAVFEYQLSYWAS
jgi:hypothetical protein